MKRPTRLVAATLVGALTLGSAATSAFAEGATTTAGPAPTTHESTAAPAPTSPPPPTTAHQEHPPSSPPAPPPTTAAKPAAGMSQLIALIDTFIGKVEAAPLEPGVKARLLGRLAEVRAKAVNGQADTAMLQAIINDIKAALNLPAEPPRTSGAPKPGDGPNATTGTTTAEPGGDKGKGGAKASLEQAAQLHLLDLVEAKVNASNLSDADKQLLLDAIAKLRADIAAGTLSGEALGRTLGQIREQLEQHHAPDGTDGGPKTGSPRDRAADAIAKEIERIKASDLPDDVKAKIIASLTNAKDHLADAGEAAKDIKDELIAQQMKRIEEIRTKLAAAIEHEKGHADEVGAIPGSDAAKLDQARAQLSAASDQLALATTAADLKAVYLSVRAAHVLIRSAAPAGTATSTTAGATEGAPTTTNA